MRFLLIVAALVVVSSTAFAADKPDTVTQYPSRIDTLRFDRINGVWKPITDTVWAQKIQVWLTPDQYKRLLELLAPPKSWWIEAADSIYLRENIITLDSTGSLRWDIDTLNTDTLYFPAATDMRDSISVWIGDCNK